MELVTIFEDDAVLAINKPAGITVNRSDTTTGEKTVQDLAEEYLGVKIPALSKVVNALEVKDASDDEVDTYDPKSAFYDRSGIVHRLDKETSGILLIAKTPEDFVGLQQEFKNREVHKTYLALAHGRLVPQTGEVNVPVGRLPWNRRQFGVLAGGRESKTRYTVTNYYRTDDKRREPVSLVKLEPVTGRTHQIRVHLQYLGHPIFSDFLYAGRKTQREDRKLLGRVFLHAAEISFLHPRTHERVTLAAPLPPELAKVMDHLVPVV